MHIRTLYTIHEVFLDLLRSVGREMLVWTKKYYLQVTNFPEEFAIFWLSCKVSSLTPNRLSTMERKPSVSCKSIKRLCNPFLIQQTYKHSLTDVFPPTSSVIVVSTVTEVATSTLSNWLESSVMVSNAWIFCSAEPSYNSGTNATTFKSHWFSDVHSWL